VKSSIYEEKVITFFPSNQENISKSKKKVGKFSKDFKRALLNPNEETK